MRSTTEIGHDCGNDAHTDSCVVDTGATPVTNGSVPLCEEAAVTEVLHERNGHSVNGQQFDITAPLAVVHHIATRSASGRLLKRPRKDLSPSRSPPRKIGNEWFCSSGDTEMLLCLFLSAPSQSSTNFRCTRCVNFSYLH